MLYIETETEDSLRKKKIEILQANIGLYCNQACNHCHVESSPKRKEMMLQQTAERCLLILENSPSIHTLDLTGKAKTVTVNHAYSEHKRYSEHIYNKLQLTVTSVSLTCMYEINLSNVDNLIMYEINCVPLYVMGLKPQPPESPVRWSTN